MTQRRASKQIKTMAAVDDSPGVVFLSWKYAHYFSFLTAKDTKNILVTCHLCGGSKTLATSKTSNSNLMKHLQKQYASTKLVEKGPAANAKGEATPAEQRKLEFIKPVAQSITQTQLNRLIARYVVEDMQPISTVESLAFRGLVSKIPVRGSDGAAPPPCRKTFSRYLDEEYANMESQLKKTFDEL